MAILGPKKDENRYGVSVSVLPWKAYAFLQPLGGKCERGVSRRGENSTHGRILKPIANLSLGLVVGFLGFSFVIGLHLAVGMA